MSQETRRARRAGRVVLQVYRDQEHLVDRARSRLDVTCREGCAHCCRLPATATVPEMVPVVEHLTARADWPSRRAAIEPAIDQHLRAFAGVDVLDDAQRTNFFQLQLPCAFLQDERCSIYALRPAVCRYHLVVSDPANCAHGAENPVFARVNLNDLETRVALRGARELGALTGGPIALVFVLAADLLGVELAVDRALVDRCQVASVAYPA